jgi:hypothetical protein
MHGWLTVPLRRGKVRAIILIALFVITLVIGCSAPTEAQTDPTPSITPRPTRQSPTEPVLNHAVKNTPTLEPLVSIPVSTDDPAIPLPTQSATTLAGTEDEMTPFIPLMGGADKIAFIEKNEIWTANLDGTALTALTNDGAEKSSLHWSPDGASLLFISDQCIKTIDFDTSLAEDIACFAPDQELYSFQISRDGTQAAISLNYELYVVPFDPTQLSLVRNGADLAGLGSCTSLSPYKHRQSLVRVNQAYWSDDGRRLAILRQGFEDNEEVELIHLLDISRCISPLPRLDEFPATRIEMEYYAHTPVLQDFAWDGDDLFALTDFRRNDGFGDLWIYSNRLHTGFKANPIGGKCCYRDPVFSPDGKYLAFVFQDASRAESEDVAIYLIPYAALDTSLVYPPLALPGDFFTAPRAKPQPALRPVPVDR